MKKFIVKILAFCIAIGIICLSTFSFHYFVIGNQYKMGYQASLIDKIDRLKSIDTPKIILVGHSNLSFGINSAMLEENLGMPVVNLGLHGGLGNGFHEEIAKINIKKGDIVIVCHSTFDDDDTIDDVGLAWITFDMNKEVFPVFRVSDLSSMLAGYPEFLKSALELWLLDEGNLVTQSCYSRTAFNEYGDVVYKPQGEQMDVNDYFAKNPVLIPKIGSTCVDRLNDYNEYVKKQGATLLVAGYPIAYGEYAEFTESDFQEFEKLLNDELSCEIISDYTDYFYPYDLFYNTALHLTSEGADIRTKQLVEDIKNWQEMALN